jgi:polysaccharide biosynthesis/export protein
MKNAPFVLLSAILVWLAGPPAAAQQSAAPAEMNALAGLGTQETGGTGDADRPALQHRDSRYRLCASDVITVMFPLTPEFDQTLSVQPDGFVSLAGAGSIRVEGMTVQESIEAIRVAYAGILHDPIVTVELKDFNKPYFIVSGQVNKPGKYDLRGYTTAAQAVAIAGGFNDAAKHSQVLLFRRVNDDWYEVKPLNLKHILQGHDVNEDLEIRSGDMLFVPQNLLSKVKRFIPSTGVGAYFQPY